MGATAVCVLAVLSLVVGARAQVFQPMPRGATATGLTPGSYDLGKVLGERAFGFSSPSVPAGYWVWNRATGAFTTVLPPAAPWSILSLTLLSGDGTKVGGAAVNWSTGMTHGCRGTVGGSLMEVGTAPGVDYSFFYAANGSGSLMGGEGSGTSVNAITWTSGSGLAVLPVPYTEEFARITGISEDGSVMVGVAGEHGFTLFPWRWTASTGVVALPDTDDYTRPLVSANGEWVICRNGSRSNEHTAFRWSVAGGREDLPMPEGATSINGLGISDDGRVVVGTAVVGDMAHPWVWREGYGSILLDRALFAKLPPSTLAGWELYELIGISRDGARALGHGELNNVATSFVVELPLACAMDFGRSGGVAGPDGVLDSNDFVAFIDLFYAMDVKADVGSAGGAAGPDGEWDNNDFIAFISAFFVGC